MFSLQRPMEGRCHDMKLLKKSNWNEVWSALLFVDGELNYIYDNSASFIRPWMPRPFTRGVYIVREKAFNTGLREFSISAEHIYKELKQFWSSQDFARKVKVIQAPILVLYKMSALWTNLRICL